jgi:hypothetical protein
MYVNRRFRGRHHLHPDCEIRAEKRTSVQQMARQNSVAVIYHEEIKQIKLVIEIIYIYIYIICFQLLIFITPAIAVAISYLKLHWIYM